MVHRIILTQRQRDRLLSLPTDESTMLNHYVLSDGDINRIKRKQLPTNQLGFALQLCALRFPGRYLTAQDIIPTEMLKLIGAQLGLSDHDIEHFEYQSVTRYEHLKTLQKFYGFQSFSSCEADMVQWLENTAIECRSDIELAELFVQECRSRQIILPGITVVERVCADAKVVADRRILHRIYSRLDKQNKIHLQAMIDETVDGRLTVYAWLKRFEIGHNSADANKLMEQLEYLQELNIPASVLDGIPKHRII